MNTIIFTALALILSVNSFALAEVGNWMVKNENVTCLIVQMDIKVNFTYKALDNTTKTALYEIPANSTVIDVNGSKCGDKEDTLKVSWNSGNNFVMTFATNASKYDLTSFIATMNTSSLLNDSAVNQTVSVAYSLSNESYDIPSNFSYHCNRQQKLNGTDSTGFFLVSKVQFEAFRHDNTHKFAVAKDCDSNISPDIVPIAVGISLIALIIVVLIAYIVGRRRQQARGYLNIM